MLECNQTITLIKCDGEAYTGQVFDGVSWYDKTKVRVEGAGLVFANATSIRIPAAAIAPTALLPKVGDQVIHGRLPLDFTVERPADLAPYHPRKVVAVADNRRGGLPHVAVVGQ